MIIDAALLRPAHAFSRVTAVRPESGTSHDEEHRRRPSLMRHWPDNSRSDRPKWHFSVECHQERLGAATSESGHVLPCDFVSVATGAPQISCQLAATPNSAESGHCGIACVAPPDQKAAGVK